MKLHHLLLGLALAAAPSTATAQGGAPQPPQAAGGAAGFAQCAQAHAVVTPELEAARARLEMARQTNSAAAMRAAIDALDAVLRNVSLQLAPCGELSAVMTGPMAGHVMPGSSPTAAPPPAAEPAKQAAPAGPTLTTTPGHNMAATPAPGARKPAASPPRAETPATSKKEAAPAAADAHAGHAMTTAANPAARLADLMCQPEVDPKTAPRATYQGKAYYFCSTVDRDLFLKSPAKYLQR